MDEKIDVDFIKWLFEKVGEPFFIKIFKKCTMVKIPGREHSFFIEEFNTCCPDYIKFLLLQKAIEGINREARFEAMLFTILTDHSEIYVYDWGKMKTVLTIMLDENNEDTAKQSILEYIYNQEKKNVPS